MPLFQVAEYQARIDKTKKRMTDSGIDLLVVTDPANMNYLTGYDGWSFYVPQMILVALDDSAPIWIGRGMDVAGARHTAFLSHDRTIGYPDSYVQSSNKHPMTFVADEIRKRGWDQQRIGLEMDCYYFTARSYKELIRSLPHATFMDCNLLVNWVRIIKSPQEILYMQQAGKIAEIVMERAIDMLAPGVRECDAVAEVYRTQIKGTSKFGGDYTAFVPMMPTGEKTSAPHLTWTDEPYRNEQAVNLELAACRNRYHCPIARTAYLGRNPPPNLVKLSEITVEGLNLTLDRIKPGMVCEEVEQIWRRHIARAGFEKDSRIGYSMGLNYPPDWGEHTASLRPGDKTVLEPNMTFHMILGMWMESFSFECSESFRVTKHGCQTFANFPRKLFIKG